MGLARWLTVGAASAAVAAFAVGTLTAPDRSPPNGLRQITLEPGHRHEPAVELPEGALHLEIINRYPHDPTAFTQGLIYRDGQLYESTGLHGQSSLRRIDLETGATIESVALADRYFGEGLERVGNQLVQLTWKNETALVYDLDTLSPVGWIPYNGEGWGLCQLDVDILVTSDGTEAPRVS